MKKIQLIATLMFITGMVAGQTHSSEIWLLDITQKNNKTLATTPTG
ncbi:MAG: hypothetical protein IPJ86_07505 [Bacteroidetes bacterium]|nr:hypothetical protein [Bacteroidota bacterium]